MTKLGSDLTLEDCSRRVVRRW